MSFEWQTEEDISWDDEPKSEPKPPRGPRRWRRWLIILGLITAVLGAGAWYAYRQVDERVTEVEARTEDEILASHNLIQTAVSNRDADLFISFLSGREPEWAFGAEEAVRKGSFLDRPAFGLIHVPDSAPPNLTVQNISPDLISAEVSYAQTYAIDIGNGLTATLTLDHTDVYRLGPNRWLLAPPEPEFWGENLVHRGTRLNLNYPDRDKELGRQLGVDLDEKLQDACNRLAGLACPADLVVQVHLSANPGTLAANFDADVLFYDLNDIHLPTPTLLGLPRDDAGYQALLRGYATQIISAMIADSAGWVCCRHVHYYQPLLDYQLAQLGLRPWPLQQRYYEQLAENAEGWLAAEQLWDVDTGARDMADVAVGYAMVEFLTTAVPDFAPAAEQEALMNQPNQRLAEWVFASSNGRFADQRLLERNFYRFIFEKADLDTAALPQVPINQQLQALCQAPGTGQYHLYNYDITADLAEQARSTGASAAFMMGLPNDSGSIVVEQLSIGAAAPYAYIWQNGRELAISHNDFDTVFPLQPIGSDPSGERIVLRVVNNLTAPFAALSLDDCLTGNNCVASALLGQPFWSPSGERSIAIRSTDFNPELRRGLMFTGNADVRQLDFLVEAASPFWIDEESVGFINGGQMVVATAADDLALKSLFSVPDLLSTIATGEQIDPRAVIIDYVHPYPNNPDLLLVATADRSGVFGQTFLFSYQISTGEIVLRQVRLEERLETQRGYRFSPNGRWLAISSTDGNGWRLQLYDLANDQLYLLLDNVDLAAPAERYIDWSADEQWLIVPDDGLLRLLLLDGSGYERPLFVTEGSCEMAVWVNPDA